MADNQQQQQQQNGSQQFENTEGQQQQQQQQQHLNGTADNANGANSETGQFECVRDDDRSVSNTHNA